MSKVNDNYKLKFFKNEVFVAARGIKVIIKDIELPYSDTTKTKLYSDKVRQTIFLELLNLISNKRGRMTCHEVRFVRNILQKTQEQLGSMLGVTGQTILRWEREEKTSMPATGHEVLLRLIMLAEYRKYKINTGALSKEDIERINRSIMEYLKEDIKEDYIITAIAA